MTSQGRHLAKLLLLIYVLSLAQVPAYSDRAPYDTSEFNTCPGLPVPLHTYSRDLDSIESLGGLEAQFYGYRFPAEDSYRRLARIERDVFGIEQTGSIKQRVEKLIDACGYQPGDSFTGGVTGGDSFTVGPSEVDLTPIPVAERSKIQDLLRRAEGLRGKDSLAAMQIYNQCIKNYSNCARLWYERARFECQTKNLTIAKSDCEKALVLKKEFVEAQSLLTEILTKQADFPAAIKSLDRELQLNPKEKDSTFIRSQRAQLLFNGGRFAEARAQCEGLDCFDSDQLLLARCSRELGELDIAITQLQKLGLEASFDRGLCYMRQGKYQLAIDQFSNSITNRNDAKSRMQKEDANSKDSILYFLDGHDGSLDYGMRARCLTSLGRFDEAIIDIDKALAIKKDSTDFLCLKAKILSRTGDHAAAINVLSQSLQSRKQLQGQEESLDRPLIESLKVPVNQIYVLRAEEFKRANHFEDAVDDLTASLASKPEAKILAERSLIELALNRQSEAQADLQRVSETGVHDSSASALKGFCALLIGNSADDAQATFQKASASSDASYLAHLGLAITQTLLGNKSAADRELSIAKFMSGDSRKIDDPAVLSLVAKIASLNDGKLEASFVNALEKPLTNTEMQSAKQLIAITETPMSSSRDVIVEREPVASPTIEPSGRNYALLVATNTYENFDELKNPVKDATELRDELINNFNFSKDDTTLLVNPGLSDVFTAMDKLSTYKYGPNDQLFIFFAGHGVCDPRYEEGFIVAHDSKPVSRDVGYTTYLPFARLERRLDAMQCKHILLCLDVCHAGTFLDYIRRSITGQRSANTEDKSLMSYKQLRAKKSKLVTRKVLASCADESVSDGRPGKNSPFASALLECLREYGMKTGGYYDFEDLVGSVKRVQPGPAWGDFGDSHNGGDFFLLPNR